MDKRRTSTTQKKFSEKTLKLKAGSKAMSRHPTKDLANKKFISRVIWDCLKSNDPKGVIEAIVTYFDAVNKLELANEFTIPRATIYHLMKHENPTLKTLAKVIHAIA